MKRTIKYQLEKKNSTLKEKRVKVLSRQFTKEDIQLTSPPPPQKRKNDEHKDTQMEIAVSFVTYQVGKSLKTENWRADILRGSL